MSNHVDITDMVGKKVASVVGKVQDDEIIFTMEDGTTYRMYHEQSCCENVYVEDITEDLQGIVGKTITWAVEVSQENPYASESGTWTFYKIRAGGTWPYFDTVIRFNGESNGYYSESVSIEKSEAKVEPKEYKITINTVVKVESFNAARELADTFATQIKSVNEEVVKTGWEVRGYK